VYGAGTNADGALGALTASQMAYNGTYSTDVQTTFTPILPAGTTASAVAEGTAFGSKTVTGNFTVIISAGNVLAEGYGADGELGNGGTGSSRALVNVNLPAGVSASSIAAGSEVAYAVGSDGKVYGWGKVPTDNNSGTALHTTPVALPFTFPSGVTPTKVYAAQRVVLVLTSAGTVYAFGSGALGATTPWAS
jgi:alpha-tubulin suppressor-like RCC1 family protein